MAEWLYEDGIGEQRAVLVEDGTILEARIAWNDLRWTVGTITDARFGTIDRARGQAFVILPDGNAAILDPLPPRGASEGAACRIEIVREPIAERDRRKWPKARLSEAPVADSPGLELQLGTVRRCSLHGPDLLEAAGWSELIEEAASGQIAFPGGMLHLSMTPAMTLIDVDGTLPRAALAIAGAAAAARALRRLGIGGSIGIDLPVPPDKASRAAADAAIDANLPQPFERTAVNGFGFVQIIRRRQRRSLPEMLAGDPAGAAARALLRRAERTGGSGPLTITAAPAVIALIGPDRIDSLARRTGRTIVLRADAATSTWGGHVEAQHP